MFETYKNYKHYFQKNKRKIYIYTQAHLYTLSDKDKNIQINKIVKLNLVKKMGKLYFHQEYANEY